MTVDDAPRLLGDIGGTNARFALSKDGAIQISAILTCNEYPDIERAVQAFLDLHAPPHARPREAAFAIAAPIVGDRVAMTNHIWGFSVAALRARLQLQRL